MGKIEEICNKLIFWLKTKVKAAGAKGMVFGLSGGVDSAVVAGLAKKTFPEDSLGIIMPCHSNPIDEEHGKLVADSLNLETIIVDLTNVFEQFIESTSIDKANKLAMANVKPRLRMTTLYYYAQFYNYLVVGPTNRSEFTIGYFTKHGDSGVDLLPLAYLTKTQIWEIAEYLNIPRIIIEKPPTAGLWENQTDEREMGFGYDVLDEYIVNGSGHKGIVERIEYMNRISEHKRKYPPIFIPKQ